MRLDGVRSEKVSEGLWRCWGGGWFVRGRSVVMLYVFHSSLYLSIPHLLDLMGPVSSSVGLEHLIFHSRSSFSSSLLSNLPFQIFRFRSGRSDIQDGPCLSKLLHSLAVRSPVDLHTARSRLSALRTEWSIICWRLLCCEALNLKHLT